MFKKVIVTSLNPAKISAVQCAFEDAFEGQEFEFVGVSVASDVPDQPMSNHETKQGALNRVRNAKADHSADYFVGVEAGIEGDQTFAWMIIETDTVRGESRSSSLSLPPEVMAKVQQGMELGHAMDAQYDTDNIKQKGGAIGLLTQMRLTRSSVYHQALILALIPFLNPQDFPSNL